MGRHRVHRDNAARQKAYRERLKAAGLGSFEAGLAATPTAGVPTATRDMHARVANAVRAVAPEIDTSALR